MSLLNKLINGEITKEQFNQEMQRTLRQEAERILNEKPRLIQNNKQLQEALQDVLDVAYWMSGSADFSPGGQAHAGWVSVARPKLEKARRVLEGD